MSRESLSAVATATDIYATAIRKTSRDRIVDPAVTGGAGRRRRRASCPSRTAPRRGRPPPRRRPPASRSGRAAVSAARRSSCSGSTATGPGAIAADAHLGRERAREHAGQHRLRRLRGAVGREGRPGLVGGDVLDQDDEAELDRAQMGGGGLRDEEAALGGRAEGRVPVGLGDLLDGPRLEAVGGRVDDEVEPAELAAPPARRARAPPRAARRRRRAGRPRERRTPRPRAAPRPRCRRGRCRR